eukprot:232551_1
MGLLDFLFKKFFIKETPKCRILILGLDNAGKTSCLKRFSDEEIDHIMPTQGFNIKKLEQQGFNATIWDLGGQKAIRTYWRNYFDNSDAIIFVIDSSDKRRIEEAGIELLNLLNDKKLTNVPLLVLANKQDLPSAFSIKEVIFSFLHNLTEIYTYIHIYIHRYQRNCYY